MPGNQPCFEYAALPHTIRKKMGSDCPEEIECCLLYTSVTTRMSSCGRYEHMSSSVEPPPRKMVSPAEDIRVVTNSLPVLNLLADNPHFDLFFIGGMMRHDTRDVYKRQE